MSGIGAWSWWTSAPVPESCTLTTSVLPVQYASHAKLGSAYSLSHATIDQIAASAGGTTQLSPAQSGTHVDVWSQRAIDGRYLCIDDRSCSSSYTTANWDWWSPQWGQKIGNRRVSFDQVAPSTVTALAKQSSGGSIGPWESHGISLFTVSSDIQNS
jgi:hypothetical protein